MTILRPIIEHAGHPDQKVHGRRGHGEVPGLPADDLSNYSAKEQGALSRYQLFGPTINDNLRGTGSAERDPDIATIDGAFRHAPRTTATVTVYRGAAQPYSTVSTGIREGVHAGYTSASTDREAAQRFVEYAKEEGPRSRLTARLVAIRIPKGTPVIQLDLLGGQDDRGKPSVGAIYNAADGGRAIGHLFDVGTHEVMLPRGGRLTNWPGAKQEGDVLDYHAP